MALGCGVHEERAASTRALVIAFALVYLVWGSTYLAIRVVVLEAPPLLAAGARFTLAGGLLFLWLRLRGVPVPTLRQWTFAGATGIMLGTIGNGGVSLAETRIASGVAALAVATVPLWMSLIDAFRPGGTRMTGRTWGGLVLGLGGVALLAAPSRERVDPVGLLIILVGTVSWATGSILSKHLDVPKNILMTAAVQMIVGGVALFVASAAIYEARGFDVRSVSRDVVLAMLYLVFVGSLVGFSAYGWLLRNAPASSVGSYAFVNPVVAVILGSLVLQEPVGPRTLVAASLIIVAAALLTIRPTKPAPAAAPSLVATGLEP